MTFLKTAFVGDFDRLSQLRMSDPRVAEICRDYELLSAELETLSGEQRDECRHAHDLNESIQGLKAELEERLRAAAATDGRLEK